jgi:glycosyltransferase involved in cell wall biosynthesis
VRVGVDTSNLRGGGGITHLVELLRHADPRASGIERVTVWGSVATLALLPHDRDWLTLVEEKELEGGLRARLAWQRGRLSELAGVACDVLFVPGGAFGGSFHPYVTMCRNMLPFDLREAARYGASWMFLRLLLLRFAQRRAFRNADGMIYLNDYVRGLVDRGHAPETTTVVPHGVSERFRFAPRPQRPISDYSEEHPFTILYTSIVDVYKHQWNVAAAVMKLREEGLPVALKLAGGSYPPSMKRLRNVLAHDTRNVVELAGEVPHAALPELCQAADLFVFASTCENMPNILIEAMAAGLPIASSSHSPMPQFLGDAGIYFDPEQPDDVARAIRTLIADPSLRATLAARAFARAAQYSWERCARETFDFLASIAKRKGVAA